MAASVSNGKVLVYGGKGALGAAIVDYFKTKIFALKKSILARRIGGDYYEPWVLNVDLDKSDSADANVLVDPLDCWIEQETRSRANSWSRQAGCRALCGRRLGRGNAASKDFIKNADLVWKQSVWSSAISARAASEFLKPGGLLQLTGAAAAVEGTPGMIGYGFAKAAVHQMVKSLGAKPSESGIPEDCTAIAILPVTLDTTMNRKWMPKADFSTWTPLSFIAEHLYEWAFGSKETRPKTGSLLKLTTVNGKTELNYAKITSGYYSTP
uniref:Dihydropteridine reductase n=1 Tax=Ditylenchus dipsaci TaxID=166011 RepID=A0A915CL10_9BILA